MCVCVCVCVYICIRCVVRLSSGTTWCPYVCACVCVCVCVRVSRSKALGSQALGSPSHCVVVLGLALMCVMVLDLVLRFVMILDLARTCVDDGLASRSLMRVMILDLVLRCVMILGFALICVCVMVCVSLSYVCMIGLGHALMCDGLGSLSHVCDGLEFHSHVCAAMSSHTYVESSHQLGHARMCRCSWYIRVSMLPSHHSLLWRRHTNLVTLACIHGRDVLV